jgi:hypothetical protein
MRYRRLTPEEIGSLRYREWIKVQLIGGEIISRQFHSFAYGDGENYALYIVEDREGPTGLPLRAVDLDRLLSLDMEHADLHTDIGAYDD